jgi:hypothetical protein
MKMPVLKLLNFRLELWLPVIVLEELIHPMQRSYKNVEDKASHTESPWLLVLVAVSVRCDDL